MIQLDTARLPRNVATVLAMRGSTLPPLIWHEYPSRAAKNAIENVADDSQLLGRTSLASEPLAAVVRALLYYWGGYPGDAVMVAQLAPEPEQKFVEALCARQKGDPDSAKALLQEVGEHAIFGALARYAPDAIGLATAPGLKRLREVISFVETWEPYAFIDAFEQARAGQYDPPAELIVRSLQCREFELLLEFALEGALGEKLPKPKPAEPPQRRPAAAPPRKRPPAPAQAAAKPKPDVDLLSAGLAIEVLCPKCGQRQMVPAAKRGQTAQCSACSTPFMIPHKKPGA